MLFGLRALFGIGMGGEWAAGMPLVIEHWPARLRGLVSGLLLGGWYWGYLLAAAAFQFIYPLFSDKPDIGVARDVLDRDHPGVLHALDRRRRCRRAPCGSSASGSLKATAAGKLAEPKISLVRIFQRDLIGTTIQTTAVIGAFMCAFYSIGTLVPDVPARKRPQHAARTWSRSTSARSAAPSSGAACRRARSAAVARSRSRRCSASRRFRCTCTPANPMLLGLGALMMGAFGCGIWGMAPAYVTERFPTEVRGVGPGFCYHAAAAIGSLMPILIGSMQDNGIAARDGDVDCDRGGAVVSRRRSSGSARKRAAAS